MVITNLKIKTMKTMP